MLLFSKIRRAYSRVERIIEVYRHLRGSGSWNSKQFNFIIQKIDNALFLIPNMYVLNNSFVSNFMPKYFITYAHMHELD